MLFSPTAFRSTHRNRVHQQYAIDSKILETVMMMNAISCSQLLIKRPVKLSDKPTNMETVSRHRRFQCVEIILKSLLELVETSEIHFAYICDVAVASNG